MQRQINAFLKEWMGVRHVVHRLHFNRAHQDGLSATQYAVLSRLSSQETPWTAKLLASALQLDPSTLTRTLASLDKRGFIERVRDQADRRSWGLALSKSGEAAIEEADARLKSDLVRIFRAMSAKEREGLIDGLEAFVKSADDILSGNPPTGKPGGQHGK